MIAVAGAARPPRTRPSDLLTLVRVGTLFGLARALDLVDERDLSARVRLRFHRRVFDLMHVDPASVLRLIETIEAYL